MFMHQYFLQKERRKKYLILFKLPLKVSDYYICVFDIGCILILFILFIKC